MAGLQPGSPTPTALTVHSQSRVLEIAFSDGAEFRIPFELMRIYSPSAEVQGHGPGQEILQTGKREVNVVELEPIGNYAVKPVFSDGHQSGIFSWDYLYHLGAEQAASGTTTSGACRRPAWIAMRPCRSRRPRLRKPLSRRSREGLRERGAAKPALRHCCFSSIKAGNKAAMPRVSPGLSGSIRALPSSIDA
jgi:DUF971 family protein